jgi:hypothetical protein
MSMIDRKHDADGFRRIRPAERSRVMIELRLPNGRCIQAVGDDTEVEAAISARAREVRA